MLAACPLRSVPLGAPQDAPHRRPSESRGRGPWLADLSSLPAVLVWEAGQEGTPKLPWAHLSQGTHWDDKSRDVGPRELEVLARRKGLQPLRAEVPACGGGTRPWESRQGQLSVP